MNAIKIPTKLFCQCGKKVNTFTRNENTEDLTVGIKCTCGLMRLYYPLSQPGSLEEMQAATKRP